MPQKHVVAAASEIPPGGRKLVNAAGRAIVVFNLGGEFFAFPNEKDADYNACKYCPVNHSCRTRHDAEEKRAVLRVSDPRSVFEGRA